MQDIAHTTVDRIPRYSQEAEEDEKRNSHTQKKDQTFLNENTIIKKNFEKLSEIMHKSNSNVLGLKVVRYLFM